MSTPSVIATETPSVPASQPISPTTPIAPSPDITDLPATQWSLSEHHTIALLRLGAVAALIWILLPYYGAILWASIIALLFAPLQRRLVRRLGRRHSLAALITTAAVLLVLVLPLALATAALAREVSTLVQALQSGALDPVRGLRSLLAALPDSVTQGLARLGLVNVDDLQRRLVAALTQGGQALAGQVFDLGQNTLEFMTSSGVALYLAFFLIRDGHALSVTARTAVPLSSDHQRALFRKFASVIRAVVRGNLLVAALQGALGGLAFYWLDVPAALLWAVVMAFVSLVPAVGAGLVWLPVAGYFLATGQWGAGLALVAWGVLVIGLVDNFLRPVLVGKGIHMPDYVVLTSTLGGMAVFGINGFVLGPTIAALFIAIWHLQPQAEPDTKLPD